MSMISELVKELRNEAQEVRLCSNECESAELLDRAADTIEMLSEKARADRPQGEWIDCKEPPSTDRNVFIAYGTDNMKSVCIGHYEHDMKMWYEDKNFFAKPLFDGMYWCEIPQFPARMKGADDE